MQRSRTGPEVPGSAFTREFVTPLNAAAVWVILAAGGACWPALAPLSAKLTAIGGVLTLTLAVHAVHEAGHLLAGLLVGLPFRSATVGLFTVRRENDGPGWRLVWDVNRSWKRVAGCVEREVPRTPGVRVALTATALGGPLASLVGGALLLSASDPWRGFGYVSLFVGVFNVVPTMILGQASDGMLVYRLWSRRPSAVAWRASLCGPA
jgi:hypothetical protein